MGRKFLFVMKACNDFKLEAESLRPQVFEAKKRKLSWALKKLKDRCEKSGFVTATLEETLGAGEAK